MTSGKRRKVQYDSSDQHDEKLARLRSLLDTRSDRETIYAAVNYAVELAEKAKKGAEFQYTMPDGTVVGLGFLSLMTLSNKAREQPK